MKIKIVIIAIVLILGLVTLFIFDPVFTRKLEFADYSVDYKWRIFDNMYCKITARDHCWGNSTYKADAEIRLYRKLIDNYNRQKIIKEELERIVKTSYRFGMAYSDLTKGSVVDIDTIIKYKDQIFCAKPLK